MRQRCDGKKSLERKFASTSYQTGIFWSQVFYPLPKFFSKAFPVMIVKAGDCLFTHYHTIPTLNNQVSIFSVTFILLSAIAFNLDQSKILSSGKGLTTVKNSKKSYLHKQMVSPSPLQSSFCHLLFFFFFHGLPPTTVINTNICFHKKMLQLANNQVRQSKRKHLFQKYLAYIDSTGRLRFH